MLYKLTVYINSDGDFSTKLSLLKQDERYEIYYEKREEAIICLEKTYKELAATIDTIEDITEVKQMVVDFEPYFYKIIKKIPTFEICISQGNQNILFVVEEVEKQEIAGGIYYDIYPVRMVFPIDINFKESYNFEVLDDLKDI